MCLRLSWPSVPPSLRNVTKSPAHVYEPAAAAVVKALQHATPQAAHACGAIAPQNHTKVRTMLQILSLADLQPFESAFWRALPERLKNGGPVLGNHSSSVLDTWWVQHTALELVRHPWCYAPPPIFRGKQCPQADDRTALVRCSGAPGLNRNATPRAPGEWSLCLPALLRALAGDANPLVYSFGIAGDWTFDERMDRSALKCTASTRRRARASCTRAMRPCPESLSITLDCRQARSVVSCRDPAGAMVTWAARYARSRV